MIADLWNYLNNTVGTLGERKESCLIESEDYAVMLAGNGCAAAGKNAMLA